MRTVMVNPTRRRRRKSRTKTKRRRRKNVALTRRKGTMKNPRRRRRRVTRRRRRRNYSAAVSNPRRRRRRRTRRRNAGIRPFVKKPNPLILQNPRRRRRRRNPRPTLQKVANKLLIYTGGSAIAVGANILAINQIQNMWARNGVRIAAAVFAPMFIKGDLGAAFSGAMLYPVVEEMASQLNIMPQEADLEALAADLEQALNEVDYDEYGYEINPTPRAIW